MRTHRAFVYVGRAMPMAILVMSLVSSTPRSSAAPSIWMPPAPIATVPTPAHPSALSDQILAQQPGASQRSQSASASASASASQSPPFQRAGLPILIVVVIVLLMIARARSRKKPNGRTPLSLRTRPVRDAGTQRILLGGREIHRADKRLKSPAVGLRPVTDRGSAFVASSEDAAKIGIGTGTGDV